MKMVNPTKLLLISCSREETTQLTEDIYRMLREDYGLEEQVELLNSNSRGSIKSDTGKNHRHPLVGDFFPDLEAQVDTGRNVLKDVIRGKHVVLVEHLLTPVRRVEGEDSPNISVNDHVMTVRGFLDVIKEVDTLQRTLVAPYLTYVRSHSIEKYRKEGFDQFDSLRLMLNDLKRDGLNALAVIDPHSEKASHIAEELVLDFHGINSFQSARTISPFKQGISIEREEEILSGLRPFQERFSKLKEKYAGKLYLVSVDNGTEKRVENFADRGFSELNNRGFYGRIVYFDKERPTYSSTSTKFKPFSKINEQDFPKGGTFIIIDDMFASGGTANKSAKVLKNLGAERVEVWTTHAVTVPKQYDKANDRSYIDAVVCLDTVPQSTKLNIEYIPASANLLAAEIYKIHQKLAGGR